MASKIKNYTSTVPMNRSIMLIEEMLMEMGAMNISKEIQDMKIKSIAFQLLVKVGFPPLFFKLEAKVDEVFNILKPQKGRQTTVQAQNTQAQAERTAWKICFDWLEVQKAMLQQKQAEPLQLFLPYLYDARSNKIFAEVILENPNHLMQLTGGTVNESPVEDAEVVP